MGRSTGRLATAIAATIAALAALVTMGAAPTAAADLEYRDTTIVGGVPNPLKIHVSMQPRAKLTDTLTGAPVAGQQVEFWPNTGVIPVVRPICVAQTDAAGVAKCSIGVRAQYDLMFIGYEARFTRTTVGNIVYADSSDLVKFLTRQ